jgi:ribonuclease E
MDAELVVAPAIPSPVDPISAPSNSATLSFDVQAEPVPERDDQPQAAMGAEQPMDLPRRLETAADPAAGPQPESAPGRPAGQDQEPWNDEDFDTYPVYSATPARSPQPPPPRGPNSDFVTDEGESDVDQGDLVNDSDLPDAGEAAGTEPSERPRSRRRRGGRSRRRSTGEGASTQETDGPTEEAFDDSGEPPTGPDPESGPRADWLPAEASTGDLDVEREPHRANGNTAAESTSEPAHERAVERESKPRSALADHAQDERHNGAASGSDAGEAPITDRTRDPSGD